MEPISLRKAPCHLSVMPDGLPDGWYAKAGYITATQLVVDGGMTAARPGA